MTLFKSAGRLLHFMKHGHKGTLEYENALAHVSLPVDGVFNVQISGVQQPFDVFTPALNQSILQGRHQVDFAIEHHENHIQVHSHFGQLILGNNLELSICNAEGENLLRTDSGLALKMKGGKSIIHFELHDNDAIIGLGEKTGPINKKGRAYTHWNTDYFAYHDGADPLYMSIPFIIMLRDSGCIGIFLNNPARSHFNLGASNNRFISISADEGGLDLYFILGANPHEIIARYTRLTGTSALPPIWALGMQQCRYSYYPQSEVLRIAQTYREKQIPLDVVYLDIHYMDAYKVFTWHPSFFPQPQQLVQELSQKHVKTIIIVDPGIKVEPGYHAYASGQEADVFLKYQDGSLYTADVWPGQCAFPDFSWSPTRLWWRQLFLPLIQEVGISGFWTDMNEPASWGQSTPETVVHRMDNQLYTHDAFRNAYGMMMAIATAEAHKHHKPNLRPFVLTRAGFAGIQRYAACWTGDNVASDEHMLLGVRLVCNLNASGVSFCGFDIGGFVGNASAQLFCRWISIGTFTPLMRIHSMIDSHANDPWSYGETAELIARNYIQLRYRLLPYIYTAFYKSYKSGTPICQYLLLFEPYNEQLRKNKYQHQYFFGDALMVAPVESQKEYVEVYFPSKYESYYHLFTGEEYKGSTTAIVHSPVSTLAVFAAAGSVIPAQALIQHTEEWPEYYELHIFPGSTTYSDLLYLDDGVSYAHESGQYLCIELVHQPQAQSITFTPHGTWNGLKTKKIKLIFHHFQPISSCKANTETLPLTLEKYAWLGPLPHFDPLGNTEQDFSLNVQTTEITLPMETLKLTYDFE